MLIKHVGPALLLLVVGLLQTAGWLTHSRLFDIGFASAASPLADVFGAVDDLEQMTQRYTATAYAVGGGHKTVEISRQLSPRFAAQPGFMLRFSPYLYAMGWFPLLKPELAMPLLRHGFCNHGPLSQVMEFDQAVQRVEIRFASRTEYKSKHELAGKNVLVVECQN